MVNRFSEVAKMKITIPFDIDIEYYAKKIDSCDRSDIDEKSALMLEEDLISMINDYGLDAETYRKVADAVEDYMEKRYENREQM